MDTENDDFADCVSVHPATMNKNAVAKGFIAPTPRQHTATKAAGRGSLQTDKRKALRVLQNARRRKGVAPVRNVVECTADDVQAIKKRKSRPATIAERKVFKEQNNTGMLIPKLPMSRIIREISQTYSRTDCAGNYYDFRFTKGAITALQEGAEDFLTHLMARLNKLADHAGRCTIYPEDFTTMESLDRMHNGGLLDRTVYRKTNPDGSKGKLVLIGIVPKQTDIAGN